MTVNLETEFKFRTARNLEVAAVDAAVRESAFDCAEATSQRHNDIYLDCANRSLAACGIGLRVRVSRGGSTITCKTRSSQQGALFVREEYETTWPSPTTPAAAADLPEALRDVIEPLLLRRPLVPILRLDVQRDVRRIAYDSSELCELAIDHVQAHGAGRSVTFSELEIEVLDDLPSCEELAAHLERQLDVQAASNDKPTHAASQLGMVGHAGWAEVPAIVANTPTTTAVVRILQCQLAAVQRAEVRVRQSHGDAPIHEMRTALRRLRSILDTFREQWPAGEATWMRAHLGALGAELGRVRDLDAMIGRVATNMDLLPTGLCAGAERAVAWLQQQRATSYDDLIAWLRSPQRLEDTQRFVDLVTKFETATDKSPIQNSARAQVAAHASRLRRHTKHLSDTSPIADFHRARITAKRLRYLLEEFGQMATKSADKIARRLTRLQEAMGDLCDAEAASDRLVEWAPRAIKDAPDHPGIGPAMGALAQVQFDAIPASRTSALARIRRERRRLGLRARDLVS